MKDLGKCPLCGEEFNKKNHRTNHHIFPQCNYQVDLKVVVCQVCHSEFHKLYNALLKLDRRTWLVRWIMFTRSKLKDPYKTYPQLKEF